ncbi:hypothetical protein KCU97_g16733, partial [Aureobasidium melanogenum]
HSQLKTGHPVRSAIHKQLNGRLVLRWVTTWESLLLYVLSFDPTNRTFFSCSRIEENQVHPQHKTTRGDLKTDELVR